MYNSCAVFDPSSNMVAKYRKMYLADTFVPGQLEVKESDVFTEGDTPAVIDTGVSLLYCITCINHAYTYLYKWWAQIYTCMHVTQIDTGIVLIIITKLINAWVHVSTGY